MYEIRVCNSLSSPIHGRGMIWGDREFFTSVINTGIEEDSGNEKGRVRIQESEYSSHSNPF